MFWRRQWNRLASSFISQPAQRDADAFRRAQTALALCRENELPIVVFDMGVPGNLRKLAAGDAVGTRVEG